MFIVSDLAGLSGVWPGVKYFSSEFNSFLEFHSIITNLHRWLKTKFTRKKREIEQGLLFYHNQYLSLICKVPTSAITKDKGSLSSWLRASDKWELSGLNSSKYFPFHVLLCYILLPVWIQML